MRRIAPALFVLFIGLTACNFSGQNQENASSSSSSSESSADLVTHNVSYTGIIEDLDMSIYQQGTHKLTLDDGQFILLETTDANLNLSTYLGKHVEVHGSIQPTVEAGGMLLRVEEIIVIGSSSSSDESSVSVKTCGGIAGLPCDEGEECVDDLSDSCDPTAGGADCAGICVVRLSSSASSETSESSISSVMSSSSTSPSQTSSSSSSSSSKPTVKSSSSSVSSTSSSVSSSSSSAALPADAAQMEEQNKQLAKQTYDQDSLWTQKYCTSHIAFCVPAHKNWYYKSFGATTSNRWHVEFGMTDIAELGDGAIILNLVAGTSASMQAQDGQIKTQGNDVIGFKDWEDGTHFEIIADARLKSAVSYMLSHITPYVAE